MTGEHHLSDKQLLRDLDGGLSGFSAKRMRAHLDSCWQCRARRLELEQAIGLFVRAREEEFQALPPAEGPRADLAAQLARAAGDEAPTSAPTLDWALAAMACVVVILAGSVFLMRQHPRQPQIVVVSVPDSRLTPGAAILASRQQVCSQANPGNKPVPAALQRRVFQEYGIVGAEPQAYEVDYLVTPALGGADDIRNLWPHSYSATAWNAHVKDALEDRLRDMVCSGSLDLAEAQQAIAGNWIEAYKKYFHTDKPLADR